MKKLGERYITVTALTKYMKEKMDLDPHLQSIWLKGEISNFNHHSRGHMYLTIKDENTRIQAVMFAGNNRRLRFRPENGMMVLLKGEVTVFEAYGQYQFYIREMEPDGIGALYLAFEQLKDTLVKQGLFDQVYKKPIPKYPEHIGVITSPTGAAIRDIISTIKRRYPIVQLTVFPVAVQGNDAVQAIVRAIARANEQKDIDTLIIGRGGGSIEDLWSFNDEKVARAIFASNIPVISGVGHETDTTISDFVADVRAATPTGAAELAVPFLKDLQSTIDHMRTHMQKHLQLSLMSKLERVRSLQNSYALQKPKQLLNEKEQYVDRLTDLLKESFLTIERQKQNELIQMNYRFTATHPETKLSNAFDKAKQLKMAQTKAGIQLLKNKQQQLHQFIDKLTLLNPLHIMKRGFAIAYTANGDIIKTTKPVKQDETIHVRLLDGELHCTVESIRGHENGREEGNDI